MTETSRLDNVESRLAYQERMIEDLNQTLTAQWKDIERLRRDIARLSERLASAEAPSWTDPGEEPPPPHW